MRFNHKTALATTVAALVALGAATAQADPANDGDRAMNEVIDTSKSINERANARNDALDAAEEAMNQAFGGNDSGSDNAGNDADN